MTEEEVIERLKEIHRERVAERVRVVMARQMCDEATAWRMIDVSDIAPTAEEIKLARLLK